MLESKINSPPILAVVVSFIVLLFAFQGMAQQPEIPQQQYRNDFSDEELRSFVRATEKVEQIRQETGQRMMKAIEDEGLTIERFSEILEAHQNPNIQLDASPEELQSFDNAARFIMDEKLRSDERLTLSIEEEGLDIETYQAILLAYQQDQEIHEKINRLLEDEKVLEDDN